MQKFYAEIFQSIVPGIMHFSLKVSYKQYILTLILIILDITPFRKLPSGGVTNDSSRTVTPPCSFTFMSCV
jgi:hypothetical protein